LTQDEAILHASFKHDASREYRKDKGKVWGMRWKDRDGSRLCACEHAMQLFTASDRGAPTNADI
jgi:hypothetical protein